MNDLRAKRAGVSERWVTGSPMDSGLPGFRAAFGRSLVVLQVIT